MRIPVSAESVYVLYCGYLVAFQYCSPGPYDPIPVLLQLDPESDEAKKKAEAERLRKAEKFMTITTGKALCVSCGYEYESKRGDPEYPITPGTQFKVRTSRDHTSHLFAMRERNPAFNTQCMTVYQQNVSPFG